MAGREAACGIATGLDWPQRFAYRPRAMRLHTSAAALFALLSLTNSRLPAAEPLRLAPTKGVVLLRNGEVLSGTIARTGDYYQVSKTGSEIRLKAADVDRVADSLAELYEEKRRRVAPDKLQDRLDLAEWCISQRLLEQAHAELAAAADIDPHHPRIVLIQRRITLVEQRPHEHTAPPVVVDRGPSKQELDRLVRGLPPHTVETFTSTIQPMLVNNCTTSGCHGPASSGKLRLMRLSLAGPPNRRLTQRNLHAVWQTIDVNEPAASPLLTQPIRPHGKAKGPIFSGHGAAQYRQLVAWVYAATRQRRPQPPAEDEEPPPAILLTAKKKPSKRRPAAAGTAPTAAPLDEPAAASEPDKGEPLTPPAETGDHTPAKGSSKETLKDDDYVPVDPFDPEVFNRRYLRP